MGIHFYFKQKLETQNRELRERLQQSENNDHAKNELLSSMGDDIYHLTQKLVELTKTNNNALQGEIFTSANNLRELLKIQANKVEIYNEKFIFTHMLDDISSYLSSNFKDLETEVIYDIDENLPHSLFGDVVHLSRVINNLLEFSIQSTPEGKVTLCVSATQVTHSHFKLHIDIIDSGQGLSNDEIRELFKLTYNK